MQSIALIQHSNSCCKHFNSLCKHIGPFYPYFLLIQIILIRPLFPLLLRVAQVLNRNALSFFQFSGDSDIDVYQLDDDISDDEDLMLSPFADPNPARLFRNQILEVNEPPMRVYINRMQEEFVSDVLSIYKKPNPRLKSNIRVLFDNENGVGEGPVREYFSMLVGLIQNGFPLDSDPSKVTLVFEGQQDHKLPIPDAFLRGSGFYRSVGRMIGHSFLHGGPPYYGLSPAVIDYWCHDSIDAITVDDVPDYDLREALQEVGLIGKIFFL